MQKHIPHYDCVILPSYREGTSRALLEAGSLGRPIIASDVPGCNNIVDDGLNGYLCKPKNIKSLVDKIEKYINLPFETKKIFSYLVVGTLHLIGLSILLRIQIIELD